jgi:uncharacterized lipoprotein YmbA
MGYKTAIIVLFTSLFLGSCASKKITDVSYLLPSKDTIAAPKMNILCREIQN